MTVGLPVDAGLLSRLREAGKAVTWTVPPTRSKGGSRSRKVREGRLHDETARVETWGPDGRDGIAATSGPVGALVLLLEVDRRGPPRLLGARNAGRDASFPDGSIVATWSDEGLAVDSRPSLHDLVELARYALR